MLLAALPGTAGAMAAHHPHPAWGPVIHEQGGVVIHYFAHPGPAQPMNAPASGSEVYLVCLYSDKGECLSGSDVHAAIDLVAAAVTIVCSIFVNCPQVWRKIVKGSGKHTGLVTFQDEGTYHTTNNTARHMCVGASPGPAGQHDRAYLSRPSRCFGVLYQSWRYEQEGNKPAYDLVNRYASSVLHLIDVLAQVSTGNGAYVYAKPDSQPGLWTTYAIYAVGTCNPC